MSWSEPGRSKEIPLPGTTAPSGLATAVGDFPITLVETSASTIVGRYNDGTGDKTAFTISIGADGKLMVTQLVALEHLQDGEAALHDDPLTLTGLISASVTITDADGDTATASTEIGGQITFVKPITINEPELKAHIASRYDELGFVPVFFKESGKEFVALEAVKERARYHTVEEAFIKQILNRLG